MSAFRSQRVKQLVQWEFMKLHKEGKTIPEIAQITQISFSRIYKLLDEIASLNHTTREELLILPHQNPYTRYRFPQKGEKTDENEINIYVQKLLSVSNDLLSDIKEVLHD